MIKKLDRIPPKLCRLLARTDHGLRLMTLSEICERSGLSRERVIQISNLSSWGSITLNAVESFSRACGVNLLAPAEHLRFLRRRKRAYLSKATTGQRKMLAKLMAGLR